MNERWKKIRKLYNEGKIVTEISRQLSIPRTTTQYAVDEMRKRELLADPVIIEEKEETSVIPKRIQAKDVGFPTQDKDEYIIELEQEISDLRNRVEWLTHSSAREHKGGTFTLNFSDLHYFDRGFLISATKSLEEKTIELVGHFSPRKFIGVLNGDVIPGRGIYRNQQLESVLPKSQQQICAGAFRFFEFDQMFEKFKMDREWIVTQGNHDYSQGEETAPPFVWAIRQLGVNAKFVGTEWVQDVSDAGTHNVLFEHGYGNSAYSPTSNKMVFETMRKIIGYQNRGYAGDNRIHRVAHGHTHWMSIGMERAEGVEFDCTGGMHRNDRANIGANTRPVGWIAYISPPGDNDILQPPTAIRPDSMSLRRDMDNPELENLNRIEAARCISGFTKKARELGFMTEMDKTNDPSSTG